MSMVENKTSPKMSAFRIDHRATVIIHQWSSSADLFSGRNENKNIWLPTWWKMMTEMLYLTHI